MVMTITMVMLKTNLGIATTARPVLEGDDGAEEEEDDRQVGESLLGEAAQGGDDDPDVRACQT